MTTKKYRRKSDGVTAENYVLCNELGVIEKYYVVFGEPENLKQSVVDDTEKWELIDVEVPPPEPYFRERQIQITK